MNEKATELVAHFEAVLAGDQIPDRPGTVSPILGEQFRGQPVYVTDAENLPFLRNHYGGELEYVWERP